VDRAALTFQRASDLDADVAETLRGLRQAAARALAHYEQVMRRSGQDADAAAGPSPSGR